MLIQHKIYEQMWHSFKHNNRMSMEHDSVCCESVSVFGFFALSIEGSVFFRD